MSQPDMVVTLCDGKPCEVAAVLVRENAELRKQLAEAQAETKRILGIGKIFERESRETFSQSCLNLQRAKKAESALTTARAAERERCAKWQFRWLVEATDAGSPLYATGDIRNSWTRDPYKAAWFPAERAAKDALANIGAWKDFPECKAIEHGFSIAQAAPVEEGATDYKALYMELIYQVGIKHPGETRHQTALQYLKRAEEPSSIAACSSNMKREKQNG